MRWGPAGMELYDDEQLIGVLREITSFLRKRSNLTVLDASDVARVLDGVAELVFDSLNVRSAEKELVNLLSSVPPAFELLCQQHLEEKGPLPDSISRFWDLALGSLSAEERALTSSLKIDIRDILASQQISPHRVVSESARVGAMRLGTF